MPKAYQDKEETALYGGAARKDSLRIGVIGTVDELNSFIGLAVAVTEDAEIRGTLRKVQGDLFAIGADLATPLDAKEKHARIGAEEVQQVEEIIAAAEQELPPLTKFILPGGTREAALLHICRSVCRRAERAVVALKKQEDVNNFVFVYINRLSDLFFALARLANKRKSVKDETWG